MQQITIDQEFKALIPPLAADERQQLEENIKRDGCRDPLVVWNGVLLDGHNRYEICTRLGIGFEVFQIQLEDKAAALDWMDANQLGRRNLSPEQMSLLRGRIYNRSKGKRGGDRRSEESKSQTATLKPTADSLGEKHGVSRDTIIRDGKFAESVESLKEFVPDVEERVMSGEVKRRDVLEAVRQPEKAQEILAHNHRAQGTGENEWYTPQEYIESARRVMGGIDLDPATSAIAQERVKAGAIFTIDDNGLEQEWHGRVWLNPPYAQPAIQQFMEKIAGEVDCGRVDQAIVLTHNYTDTRWFHIGASSATAICFTRGRIGFLSPEGKKAAPTQGQAFFYYGDNPAAFSAEFSQYGFVVEVVAEQAVRAAA